MESEQPTPDIMQLLAQLTQAATKERVSRRSLRAIRAVVSPLFITRYRQG